MAYIVDSMELTSEERLVAAVMLLRDVVSPPVRVNMHQPRKVRTLPEDLAAQLAALSDGIDNYNTPEPAPSFCGLDDEDDENVRVVRPGRPAESE
jgi:hypothetical protein